MNEQALGEEVAKAMWAAATAVDDVYTWASSTIHQIDEYEALGADRFDELRAREEADPATSRRESSRRFVTAHHIVLDANHLIDALRSKNLPYGIPRKLGGKLHDHVGRLRPLLEHWEQHRTAFSDADAGKHRVRERYTKAHPGKTPWSAGWSPDRGWVIGGVLNLSDLRAAVEPIRDRAEALLEQRRRETERHAVAQSLATTAVDGDLP
jgi:hypothetical protein